MTEGQTRSVTFPSAMLDIIAGKVFLYCLQHNKPKNKIIKEFIDKLWCVHYYTRIISDVYSLKSTVLKVTAAAAC